MPLSTIQIHTNNIIMDGNREQIEPRSNRDRLSYRIYFPGTTYTRDLFLTDEGPTLHLFIRNNALKPAYKRQQIGPPPYPTTIHYADPDFEAKLRKYITKCLQTKTARQRKLVRKQKQSTWQTPTSPPKFKNS